MLWVSRLTCKHVRRSSGHLGRFLDVFDDVSYVIANELVLPSVHTASQIGIHCVMCISICDIGWFLQTS